MTLLLALLACATSPPEPPNEADAPEPTEASPATEASWGEGCSPTNEPGCELWGRKARKLGQDYRPFLGPSCERAHATSCFWLAHFLEEDGHPSSETAPHYRRACDLGDGNGCRGLAKTLEGDEKQAVLAKGCALKCAWCCKDAGLPTPNW